MDGAVDKRQKSRIWNQVLYYSLHFLVLQVNSVAFLSPTLHANVYAVAPVCRILLRRRRWDILALCQQFLI